MEYELKAYISVPGVFSSDIKHVQVCGSTAHFSAPFTTDGLSITMMNLNVSM